MTNRPPSRARHLPTQPPSVLRQSQYDIDRSQSNLINLVTEDFLAGYTQDGRMSVVRRFFCLFVTFDFFFTALLWLICVMINGGNIYNAFEEQIVHYSIYTSLFDIVLFAFCRFVFLTLFYGCLSINHWFIIAVSTSGSCAFLITKVYLYNWTASPQPVFQVVIIISSFVLAWGEAWFLDFRVIPQERHSRNYFTALISGAIDDRSPLLAPFLRSLAEHTESIGNFYSPYESANCSDEEDNNPDSEYKQIGIECVQDAHTLLTATDWKEEKRTSAGDLIRTISREKFGRIYRLTGRVHCGARTLLDNLFYQIEEVPKWNPTILELKILRTIDKNMDITYQTTIGGGGGIIKCRDFVNLRCWYQVRPNGRLICDDDEVSPVKPELHKSRSEAKLSIENDNKEVSPYEELSKSLGAQTFHSAELKTEPTGEDGLFISAATSIDYPGAPTSTKFVRGQNKISCWAMQEIPNEKDWCTFDWLLCVDLKGFIPKYVLDTAYTTLMQDFMSFLRIKCEELQKGSERS